jgi:hypothetical protein
MPLPTRPDVAVIGGGSAGLAAALAAARCGAETVLVERHSVLGGMGTTAMVHTFCGLYHPDVSHGPQWLNPGIPKEIGCLMLERTQQKGPDLMGNVYVLRQHPSHFAVIADELCAAEPTLHPALEAELIRAEWKDSHWDLRLLCRGTEILLQPRSLVDTSGDAVLAKALASSQVEIAESHKLYRPAWASLFHGLPGALEDSLRLTIAGWIVEGIRQGDLPACLLGASFRPSPHLGEAFLTIDLEAGGAGWDPHDPACRASVAAEGRAAALDLWRLLRQRSEFFAQCPPPAFPSQPGVRESSRWIGDYTLTAEDLIACKRFADDVALAGWPMEIRESARGPKFRYFSKAEPAGIPARCLTSARHPRLWFAGRCLSATHEALASVRVMGTCMATGQAAGRMAAGS